MLSEFVTDNRAEIILRCRARVAARMAPRPTELELEHGIPLFLDELAATLRSKLLPILVGRRTTATMHGADLLRRGFTIAQVVHDYGDACQTITELAIERGKAITNEDFRTLNSCIDDAIAEAVTEFGRQSDLKLVAADANRATEDLGVLAHELRNMLQTATLAFEALRSGSVGIAGSTGAVLGRSLMSLQSIVDRSLAVVRLNVGIEARERVMIDELIEEVEVSALMEARTRGHELIVETRDVGAAVEGDRQILASVVSNLLQNAYKYTHPKSRVTLRTSVTGDRVRIEVEDECGGLPPGAVDTLFRPFTQRNADRSGLGLGLAICLRGVETMGGTLQARDLPGQGCVFMVELPRAPDLA